VVTADGGHDAGWVERGINHLWMAPAVSQFECKEGTPRDEYRSELAFIGSWQGGYHSEWKHRAALVRWLERTHPDRVKFWPRRGAPGVRGRELRDIIASTDIVIGDSCLAGGITHYWSDRVPETLGRGGFLLHPEVEGFAYEDGVELATWHAFDWDDLAGKIDYYLANPDRRAHIARTGRAFVLAHETYTHRMDGLIDYLYAEEYLVP
jgi:hypothetical protein